MLACWLVFPLILAVTGRSLGPAEPVLAGRETPLLPSQDPFYDLPEGFETAQPGDILRYRHPPNPMAAFGSIVLHLDSTYQIQYRTTDALGNPTATVMTVLVPHNADMAKVLSYEIAQDSANVDCAASYVFQKDHAKGPKGTGVTESELLVLAAGLEQGWVVIVPDYLGPNAAHAANDLLGHATLDGIRAAKNSASLNGISDEPTVTLWGYSGGSVPALSAAELRATYAPDVQIAGVAAGGVISNLTAVMNKNNKQERAGLTALVLLGLGHQYPEAKRAVEGHLLPQHRDRYHHVGDLCYVELYNEYKSEDVYAYFDEVDFIHKDPVIRHLLRDNVFGKRTPDVPVYIYEAIHDQVVDSADADCLVETYCNHGAQVEYQREILANHETTAILTLPKTISWLKDRMDNKVAPSQCVERTTLSTLLDISTATILPKFIIDTILDLLSKPVGPIF